MLGNVLVEEERSLFVNTCDAVVVAKVLGNVLVALVKFLLVTVCAAVVVSRVEGNVLVALVKFLFVRVAELSISLFCMNKTKLVKGAFAASVVTSGFSRMGLITVF